MTKIGKLSDNNSAVSPIIGEIVMVAIVVILGAIIASYAFGNADMIDTTYLVSTSADKINQDNIVVSFMGGQDADKVLYLNVSVNGKYYNETWSDTEANTFGGDGINPIQVGKTVLLEDGGTDVITTKNHVIIVATFIDGTKQVVMDTEI